MSTPGFESPIPRDVLPQDVEQLRPILEHWIRDSETGLIIRDEVEESLQAIQAVSEGDMSRIYVVAEDTGGKILGVMGLTDASETLEPAAPESVSMGRAGELINAFVSPDAKRMGVGKMLVRELEYRAKGQLVLDDILVTSGPRYEKTGWPFWKSLYGEPVLIIPDAFGPGRNAPVWRKSFFR